MNTPFVDVLAQEIPMEKQEKYFVKPPHIDRIISPKATIIIGERGCGKTTALRYLEDCFNNSFDAMNYIGVYHRFETARSRALINPDFNENQNIRVFSQAIASIIIKLLCEVLHKLKRSRNLEIKNEIYICKKVVSLVEPIGTTGVESFEELGELFELFRHKTVVNSQNDKWICYFDYATLLDTLCKELRKEEAFKNTCFCILFDEFENLSISQQRVINSFIKSATYYLTYKVCMRPDGFLTRDTLSNTEHIREIDDYEEISFVNQIIGDDSERKLHLKEICRNRLKYFYDQKSIVYEDYDLDIENYLEVLKDEDEINSWIRITEYKDELRKELYDKYPDKRKEIDSIDDVIDLRLIKVLSNKKKTEEGIFSNIINKTTVYNNWRHNYKNNTIYLIISECEQEKKYCGFSVFIKLSNGNTRRVLELLHYAFGDYDNSGHVYKRISVKEQTNAVYSLSNSYFDQINAIPLNGNKVKNLARAVGNLFERNMLDGRARKFEVNSFAIIATHTLSESQMDELNSVLHDSIVWGVLIPNKANKIKKQGDMVLDGRDLVLHPLLSPYLKFSYRKRQKNDLLDYKVYSMLKTITNNEIANISKEINTRYVQGTLWGSDNGDI